MDKLAIRTLRLMLGLAFLVMLFAQVLGLPWLSHTYAEDYPEVAQIQVPMLIVSILAVVCGQLVVLSTWRLLSMIQQDSIFSEEAFGWVSWIIGATLSACALVFAVFVYTLFWVDLQQPGVAMAELAAVGGGLTFALLLFVMRGLLRKATALRSDMAEVT